MPLRLTGFSHGLPSLFLGRPHIAMTALCVKMMTNTSRWDGRNIVYMDCGLLRFGVNLPLTIDFRTCARASCQVIMFVWRLKALSTCCTSIAPTRVECGITLDGRALERRLEVSYLSPQGFHRSSQLGLRVTTGARRDWRLVTDRGWMPSEAWPARSAMAAL
jgi:hypothetical protein